MPCVVVAVTQRLTRRSAASFMGSAAPQRFPVLTAPVAADVCVVVAYSSRAAVHRSVAGCSEGGEHLRVSGDRGGDVVVSALAAGVHELPGVAGVEFGAGWADCGADLRTR